MLSKTWIRKEQNWKLGGSSLNNLDSKKKNLDSYICGQYIVVKYTESVADLKYICMGSTIDCTFRLTGYLQMREGSSQ